MKKYKTYRYNFSALGTDGFASFTDDYNNPVTYLPIPAGWDRIIAQLDVTTANGTSPTLDCKFKTLVNNGGTAPVTGTLNLTDSNGTAFAMTQSTAASNEIKAIARKGSDADGPGISNAGTWLAAFLDFGGTSPAFTGTLSIAIECDN